LRSKRADQQRQADLPAAQWFIGAKIGKLALIQVERNVMKLPDFHKVRRGEVTGRQTAGPPLKTRYWRCEKCSGYFDLFDFASAFEHTGPLPHPAEDQPQ
jgi:hypothetical protein